MNGILVLAHGSREKATENTLKEVIEMLREELKNTVIESAFLQFSERNLKNGLDLLIERGVKDIKIIPYFLFDGVHIREDIPKEIEEYLVNKLGIQITMGKTLGADQRLVEVLADRVKEVL